MELDTGSPVSFLNKPTFDNLANKIPLQPSNKTFTSFTGHPLKPMGMVHADIVLNKLCLNLPIYITDNDEPNLMGLNWIKPLAEQLDIVRRLKSSSSTSINKMSNALELLLTKYSEIFADEAGLLKTAPVSVYLEDNAIPKIARPADVPYAENDTKPSWTNE